jgi:alkane 1-monooxygenase
LASYPPPFPPFFPSTRAYPERVAPHHSWNANTLATNAVSFRLQRHSDHHAHAERPFHRLRDARDAPQLPAGYSALMLAAAFAPGLFRRVMDPRVAEERARAAAKAE